MDPQRVEENKKLTFSKIDNFLIIHNELLLIIISIFTLISWIILIFTCDINWNIFFFCFLCNNLNLNLSLIFPIKGCDRLE